MFSSTNETRTSPTPSTPYIYLNNNPLKCDLSLAYFLLGTDQREFVEAFRENCIEESQPKQKYYNGSCPADCKSTEIKFESHLQIFISCEGKGLTNVPNIELANVTSIDVTSISVTLNISNKSLTELPNLRGHSLVTVIQASHNKISNIEVKNFPSNLRALDVSHNNIQMISADVVQHLQSHKSLEIFFFKGNPLSCDCSSNAKALIEFVKVNESIMDLQGAKCNFSTTLQFDLSNDLLENHCKNERSIQILAVLTILAILTGISSVLFYRYRQFIKVWLYVHNVCLWWVDEEHLDRDKEYDAFLSYSHLDADFVYRLVEELENNKPCFRLCVHERDFLGGAEIEKSVGHSFTILFIISSCGCCRAYCSFIVSERPCRHQHISARFEMFPFFSRSSSQWKILAERLSFYRKTSCSPNGPHTNFIWHTIKVLPIE